MKILSVDFDFFQNTTKELIKFYYPDGADLGTKLSQIIWAARYDLSSESKNKIESVEIDDFLFGDIMVTLLSQNPEIPIMITESHVDIYDFVRSHVDKDIEDLQIVNVDFHHDVLNDNQRLDCGNWISHLKKLYPGMSVSWITRELSLDCYRLDDVDIENLGIEFNLDNIISLQFDAVFICRSDCWSPPHLDVEFTKLVFDCLDYYSNVHLNNNVICPRPIGLNHLSEDELSFLTITKDLFDNAENKRGDCQC